MKKTIIITSLVIILLLGLFTYQYVMHGGARDLSTEKAEFTLSSKAILDEFTTNQELSNKKYLEKAVAVKGTITDVNSTQIIVDNAIICILKNPNTTLVKNQTVTVKGRVVGFDDLMGELKLDQCFCN
ncbi:hypothetical protein ACFQZF_14955 [Flavobacterium myungsuense]|uniref:tRNA_anti-like n=1 Tax=Flavobacterium myungsuense TaxID=651823 RepID=A0ABW3J045_9FLAO